MYILFWLKEWDVVALVCLLIEYCVSIQPSYECDNWLKYIFVFWML